ncbi:hypothetical protein [Flavobacterium sp.]
MSDMSGMTDGAPEIPGVMGKVLGRNGSNRRTTKSIFISWL